MSYLLENNERNIIFSVSLFQSKILLFYYLVTAWMSCIFTQLQFSFTTQNGTAEELDLTTKMIQGYRALDPALLAILIPSQLYMF